MFDLFHMFASCFICIDTIRLQVDVPRCWWCYWLEQYI